MPLDQAVNREPNLSKWQAAKGVMRLPFLSLALISVFLGAVSAWYHSVALYPVRLLAVLVAALSAHGAVNALNEYHDFCSGLDLQTQRTPFSGGSGTLPSAPEHAPLAKHLGIVLSLVTIIIGIWLALTTGPWLWVQGILGMMLVWTYTGPLNRHPLLCLVAPGLGFGVCIVMGTEYALAGSISNTGIISGVLVALLTSTLLLLNQFPDCTADAEAGRRHLVIRYGYGAGAITFIAMQVTAFLVVGESVVLGLLPSPALLAMFPALLVPKMVPAIIDYSANQENFTATLGQNVLLTNLTPLLLAVGLILGK